MFSHLLGLDYRAPAQSQPLNSFLQSLQDPQFGQQQLQQMTQSTIAGAMPQFMQQLQGSKEDSIRRGISTGDLGSSFEGDLTSAFQRNIANSVGAQSMNLFNNRNSMLMGGLTDQLDREQAAQNDASQRKSGLMGGILGLGGSFLGGRSGSRPMGGY